MSIARATQKSEQEKILLWKNRNSIAV